MRLCAAACVVLLGLSVVYALVPADRLPSLLGHAAVEAHHWKRAIAAGVLAAVFAAATLVTFRTVRLRTIARQRRSLA